MAAPEAMMASGPEGLDMTDYAGASQAMTAPIPEGIDAPDYAGLDSHILGARPKPRLSEDERLEREVSRRRQVELERRARIFDAKRRTIGLDVEALEAQRAENQQRRQQERAEARAGEREMMRAGQVLAMMEMDKQRTRKEMERECREYSLANLNFQSRREFDLNDPIGHRKVPPTRVGDQDPRLGPASMQRFSGEDLTQEERKRQQQMETVNFIEQQKFEKAMLSKAEGEENKAFADDVAQITMLRNEMEAGENGVRRDLLTLQRDTNLQLAADKQRQRKLDALDEMERNARELAFHASDPFLNEIGGRRRGGPGGPGSGAGGEAEGSEGDPQVMKHVRGGNFKGSTRAQREHLAREQLTQADDDYARRDLERLDDHVFAKQQETIRKQMITMEREKARMKRAMAEQVARENRGLHQEQKAGTKRMDQVFTNEFRPEFFEQFGTSTR